MNKEDYVSSKLFLGSTHPSNYPRANPADKWNKKYELLENYKKNMFYETFKNIDIQMIDNNTKQIVISYLFIPPTKLSIDFLWKIYHKHRNSSTFQTSKYFGGSTRWLKLKRIK